MDNYSSSDDIWCRFCKSCKRLLYNFTGYPNFERFIDQLEEGPGLNTRELRQFSGSRLFMAFLITLSSVYCVKTAIITHLSITSYDHQNPDNSLHLGPASFNDSGQLVDLEKSYHFACLLTNCTDVSYNHKLAEDLSRLPILAICRPRVVAFFSPVVNLGPFGEVIFIMSGFIVFFLGIIIPVYFNLISTTNHLCMFMVYPLANIYIIRETLRHYLSEMSFSLKNYIHIIRYDDLNPLNRMLTEQEKKDGFHYKPSYWRSGNVKMVKDNSYFALLRSKLIVNSESYIEDCLPIIRTDWWRYHISYKFFLIIVSSWMSLLMVALVFLLHISNELDKTKNHFELMNNSMSLQGCKFWRIIPESSLMQPEAQTLGSVNVTWSWFVVIEISTLYVICLYLGSCLLTIYYLVFIELSFYLNELRFLLELALDYCHLLYLYQAKSKDRSNNSLTINVINMNRIRNLFEDQVHLLAPRLVGDPLIASYKRHNFRSKIVSKIALQQSVLQLVSEQEDSLAAFVELVEKIYLNFRLFIELIRRQSPVMACKVFHIYTLVYGLVIAVVWHSNQLKYLKKESLAVLSLALFLCNLVILVMSNFHASAKKIQPIVWSLIAQLNLSDDIRIKHIRCLWIKQIRIVEDRGGITIDTFNLRISYVHIIQLLIATGTILVFTLGR